MNKKLNIYKWNNEAGHYIEIFNTEYLELDRCSVCYGHVDVFISGDSEPHDDTGITGEEELEDLSEIQFL